METFDAVVVGGGVMGSFTAMNLALLGHRTLLLEQHSIKESKGSSRGGSRILRWASNPGMEFMTDMIPETMATLRQLEKETGQTLFMRTGVTIIPKYPASYILSKTETFKKRSLPFDVLDNARIGQKYPVWKCPDVTSFFHEYGGGVLLADKIIHCALKKFQQLGGIIRDCEKVTKILPGTSVSITTNKGHFNTTRLVLTIGPWMKNILPTIGIKLPLKVTLIYVCYWKEKVPGSTPVTSFPVFSDRRDFHVYGLPAPEYPGYVKICHHSGPEVSPDDIDTLTPDEKSLDRLKEYVAEYFPGLEPSPAITHTCLYTYSPDSCFILDKHPLWSNIALGAGFSGHGFKYGPVVGKILAEIATGKMSSYDLSPFRIGRFLSNSNL